MDSKFEQVERLYEALMCLAEDADRYGNAATAENARQEAARALRWLEQHDPQARAEWQRDWPIYDRANVR